MPTSELAQQAQTYLRKIADSFDTYQVDPSATSRLFTTPRGRVGARIDSIIEEIRTEGVATGHVAELIEMLALFAALSTPQESTAPEAPPATPAPRDADIASREQELQQNAAELEQVAQVIESMQTGAQATQALREKLGDTERNLATNVAAALNQLPKGHNR